MFSSKPFAIALCLLCLALPARAEKPYGRRAAADDSRSSGALQQRDSDEYTREVGGKSFDEWKKELTNPDASVRSAAILALMNFKQAADAVPDVVRRLLEDGDASPRAKAAKFLGLIRAKEADRTRVIKALARAVSHDPQTIIRYEAAVALQSYCPFRYEKDKDKEEREALQDLVVGVGNHQTYEVREACIETLIRARMDPKKGPDEKVTEALIMRANPGYEATTQVRLKAIVALGAQGRPTDPKLLKRVMDVLKMPANYRSTRPTIRIWSHVAIIALEVNEKSNKKDLDHIAEYLNDRVTATRVEAITALGALEVKAKDYVGDILKLLNYKRKKDIPIEAAAALALGRIGTSGQKVIDALIQMTEDDKPERWPVIHNACMAFLLLGANNAEVMQALEKVRDHKSLNEYQKSYVDYIIKDLQNPRKIPVQDRPKDPEKRPAR